MLALSPPLFSTTYGWPLEDLITQNHQQDCNEANSYHSLLEFPTNDQIQHDFATETSNSISSGGAENDNNGDHRKKSSKKLNHNASERDRRKKVNDLYAFLRSLLPVSNDRKQKKVSIPQTVSRALKYIPDLQKEVEILTRKKEKLSSYSSTATSSQEHLDMKKKSAKDAVTRRNSSVVSSVSVLDDKEAMIQLVFSNDNKRKNNKDVGLLSKVLEYLDKEEDGFVLLNSTTFKCSGEGISLNTLHLQVQGDMKIKAEKLKEKLRCFEQQSNELLL